MKAYYPPGMDRLGYYAELFDVVEANSTYSARSRSMIGGASLIRRPRFVKRFFPPFHRGASARATARGRQTRRHSDADGSLRRPEAELLRLPGVGSRAARQPQMLVEFRHGAWFDQAEKSLDFLERNDMTHVIVDTPVFPVVVARTGAEAYVRFHGRNSATWYKRTARPPSALTRVRSSWWLCLARRDASCRSPQRTAR